MLLKLGAHYGLTVDIVDLVKASSGGVTGQVSSSKIRDALNQGLMQQVSESLGRPYRLMADVLPAELPLGGDKIRQAVGFCWTGTPSSRCSWISPFSCT